MTLSPFGWSFHFVARMMTIMKWIGTAATTWRWIHSTTFDHFLIVIGFWVFMRWSARQAHELADIEWEIESAGACAEGSDTGYEWTE